MPKLKGHLHWCPNEWDPIVLLFPLPEGPQSGNCARSNPKPNSSDLQTWPRECITLWLKHGCISLKGAQQLKDPFIRGPPSQTAAHYDSSIRPVMMEKTLPDVPPTSGWAAGGKRKRKKKAQDLDFAFIIKQFLPLRLFLPDRWLCAMNVTSLPSQVVLRILPGAPLCRSTHRLFAVQPWLRLVTMPVNFNWSPRITDPVQRAKPYRSPARFTELSLTPAAFEQPWTRGEEVV